MPVDTEGSVTQFFKRVRDGDRSATGQLWQRFFPRLLGLARKTLAGSPQRVADAEDAVQGAFLSFWKRTERGDFDRGLHRDNLWKLLAVMTVRKARKQIAREQAEKRGGGRVFVESSLAGIEGDDYRLDQALGSLPAADVDLSVKELLEMLSDELRAYAILRLMGYKNREIADLMDCTERKVERKLRLIRLTWQYEVDGADE